MNIIILANRLSKFSRYLPSAIFNGKPVYSSNGLNTYEFDSAKHHLYFVEVEGVDAIVMKYEKESLYIKAFTLQEVCSFIGETPCLIVIHHWGRGRTFQFNNKEPELQVLQIGFNGQWNIISREPCMAVTSGGSDPISDLLECFFEEQNESNSELRKIEERLQGKCQS